MELEDLIQTIENQHQIISVVGAGGKSTLIRTLAERLSRRGRRVLVTTTTHIWKPEDGTYAEGEAEAERLWKQGRYAVVGVPASLWGNESAQQKNAGNQGLKSKLTSLPEKELHQYMFDDMAYVPSQTVSTISDTIVNSTGVTKESALINTSEYNETVGANGTDALQKNTQQSTQEN